MSHIPSKAIPHAKASEPAPSPRRRIGPAAAAIGGAVAGGIALAAAALWRQKSMPTARGKRKSRAKGSH